MTNDETGESAPDGFRIMVVCLGNICRSPMAAAVLRSKLAAAGQTDVLVDSSGTSDWHVGEPADARAGATLRAAGYDPTHSAQQFQSRHLSAYDLILVMDDDNLRQLQSHGPAGRQVRKFREFDPIVAAGDELSIPDVPDPYYGGSAGFEDVLRMVERTSEAIVAALQAGELRR